MDPSIPASLGWRLGLRISFGVIVPIVLALAGDLQQVGEQMITFRWSLFPLVLLLTLTNYTLRFVKWHFYPGQIGIHNLPVLESARLFVASFPLPVTPGKLVKAFKMDFLEGPLAAGTE